MQKTFELLLLRGREFSELRKKIDAYFGPRSCLSRITQAVHEDVFGLHEGVIGRCGRSSGSHWSPCALSMWAHTLALFDGGLPYVFRLGICYFVRDLIMFPATVTENLNFGDGGGLDELVIAHGVEASFGASLDEQRSTLCS